MSTLTLSRLPSEEEMRGLWFMVHALDEPDRFQVTGLGSDGIEKKHWIVTTRQAAAAVIKSNALVVGHEAEQKLREFAAAILFEEAT